MSKRLKVGELVYKISADMDNLKSELKKSNTEVKRLSGAMKKGEKQTQSLTKSVFKGIAAYDLLRKGLDFARRGFNFAINAASNLEESINAVNVVFEDGADTVLKFGKQAAKSVGLANAEFNQLSTVTGALLKDTGLSAEEVAEQTINLTRRAADMASVFNTDVKDALSAINQAIRGQTEGIRRYAGNVTEAELQTELLSRGIERSVTEMTEQEKRLLRLDIIMRQTENTAGDFQNTIGSFANQQRVFQATLTDVAATLGDEFIPTLQRGFQIANRALKLFAKNLNEIILAAQLFFGTVGTYIATTKLALWLTTATTMFGRLTLSVRTAAAANGFYTTSLNVLTTAFYRARVAAIAFQTALGVLGAVVTAASILIVNSAKKTREAWEDATESAKKSVDIQMELIRQTHAQQEEAAKSSSETIRELAKANHDYTIALVKNETQEVISEIHKRRQELADSMKADISLKREWERITKTVNESISDSNEDVAESEIEKQLAAEKAAAAAQEAQRKITSFREELYSLVQNAKSASAALRDDLTGAFNKFAEDVRGNVEDSVSSLAQLVIEAENNIADLQKQLWEAETNEQKKALQEQIAEQEKVLQAREGFEERQADRIAAIREKLAKAGIDADQAGLDSLMNVRTLEEQIEEERRLASLDEFTRFEETQSKKLELLADNLIAEVSILREKINKQERYEADLTAYLVGEESKRLENTDAWAQATIEKYGAVADSLNNLLSTQAKVQSLINSTPSVPSVNDVTRPAGNTTSNITNNNVNAPISITGSFGEQVDANALAKEIAWQLGSR